MWLQTNHDMTQEESKFCTTDVLGISARQHFRAVGISGNTLYIYSAYQVHGSVRIIALKKRNAKIQGLYCVRFYLNDLHEASSGKVPTLVKASVRDLHDHHNLDYTAAYITCPFQQTPGPQPPSSSVRQPGPFKVGLAAETKPFRSLGNFSVETDRVGPCSVKDKHGAEEHNEAQSHMRKKVEFTVCSSILHSNFSDFANVVEKIEMGRLLGARRLVFYNTSISDNVDIVLNVYLQDWADGKETLEVVVLPWKLPDLLSADKLYAYGKVAAINDCLHRFRNSSNYIVFTDLGEFIIPRNPSNWSLLIAELGRTQPDSSEFLFQNTVFRKQWPSPANGFQTIAKEYNSAILGFTLRENYFFPQKIRSKMIVDPMVTDEIGIHHAWQVSGKTYNVSKEYGLIQEYKKYPPTNDVSTEKEWAKRNSSVSDVFAVRKFGARLAARLKGVWSRMTSTSQHSASDIESTRDLKSARKMSTASEEELIRHLPMDTTHRFQQVKSLDSMILVYAAIWQGDNVRIVALKTLGADIKNLSCVFFRSLKEPSPSFTAAALVNDIPEHHDHQHTAASITCPVQRQTGEQLRLVGLTNQTHFPPTWPEVILPVEALETGQESDENKEELASGDGMNPLEQNVGLSVCVPAMYGFKNAAELVEKIEMSRLLGAGRVVFYNYSISSNVDAVLRMYARDWSQGRDKLEVKVYPWHLPEFEQSGKKKKLSIHYLGQMAAIDHCLHRYRQFSQFIIFSDMDEFAVPLQHKSLYELVAERQKLNSSRMGFLFQSSVFNKDRPSPALGFETDALRYGSAVLGLTSRDNFYFPENVRSKVMVDPKKVDVMGIHYIFEGSGITDIVPLEQGFLAHYREPLNNCKPGVVDSRVVDRFGKRLAARLRKVWSRLKNVSLGWEPFKKKDSKRC